MRSLFDIKDGVIVPSQNESAPIVIYMTPDETERKYLTEKIDITLHDIESALDPDEISRVEVTPDYTYIIWKRPNNVSFEQQLKFEVSSVGLVYQKNRLTLILGDNSLPLFNSNDFRKVNTLNSFLLKFLLYTVHHYFGHLKAIRQITSELQGKLNISSENRYLLQMFTLSESLIYYLNALEANHAVLTKMRGIAEKIGFSLDEIEFMEDIMIEHQQCRAQTEIYSSVLSGLMDARGSVINNNMNVLLRNLTIINVVFMPLNLIASIFGMSEYSAMTNHVDLHLAYFVFIMLMVIVGWGTWLFLTHKMTAVSRSGNISNKHLPRL